MKQKVNARITIVLLSVISACSPAGQISVNNINDSGFKQSGSVLYSLPQTVIDVSIEAEETEVIPGPYRQYAEKYLGIRGVSDKTENTWTITEAQITAHSETDPDYIYSVMGSYNPVVFPGFSKLVQDSMIIDLSMRSYKSVFYNEFPVRTGDSSFTDLSVKRNFEAEKDIEVSKVMPDTNYLSKPASRNRLKGKTMEQKAEEAANFIIKLKKRRFKMISGQSDSMIQGEAMGEALKELARLEETYLSLFIGKRSVYHHKRVYHFTPVSGKKTDRIVLFRFSDTDGYLDAGESRGIPVMLDLKNNNKIKGLEHSETPFNSSSNTLLYRIPDQADVKLIWGETILANAFFPVFQSGAMVRMKLDPLSQKR